MSLAGQRLDASRYVLVPRTLVFGFRDGKVLLQKVPPKRGAWAGLWNGIGGHIEPGESAAQAAAREFHEETKLSLTELRLAGGVIVDLGASPGIGISVFTGRVDDGTPVAGAEGELRWFVPAETRPEDLVEDLPTLLPRAMACLNGAPPFSAIYRYDSSGRLTIDID